jgi:hypothetical protein
MAKMKFVCNIFNPSADMPCPFEIIDDESVIVNEATDHEVDEHEYQDTPILRQQITDSLVPAIPPNS